MPGYGYGKAMPKSKPKAKLLPSKPPSRWWKSRKSYGALIGSKRNDVRVASRKRVQKLIDKQAAKDKLLLLRNQVKKTIDEATAGP